MSHARGRDGYPQQARARFITPQQIPLQGKWFASHLTAASLFGRSYLCGTLRYYPSASIKLRLSMTILLSKTPKVKFLSRS